MSSDPPMKRLAAELIGRLLSDGRIELARSHKDPEFLEDLAEHLGALVGKPGPGALLAAWLADHAAIEEVYATDEELEQTLQAAVAAVK